MTQQLSFGWTWRDLGAVALIGGLSGSALSPLVSYAVSFMRTGMRDQELVLLSAGSSLLFAPSLFSVAFIRRPGAALSAQVFSGAAMALWTPFPADSFTSCILCGVIAEVAVAAVTRYRRTSVSALLTVGGAIGVAAGALNLIGHRLTLPPPTLATVLVATLAAFVGCAGISGWAAQAIQGRRRPGDAVCSDG